MIAYTFVSFLHNQDVQNSKPTTIGTNFEERKQLPGYLRATSGRPYLNHIPDMSRLKSELVVILCV